MSDLPALCRESRALRGLHHVIGFGLRKLNGRVGHADARVWRMATATSKEIINAVARRNEQIADARLPAAKWPRWSSHQASSHQGQGSHGEGETDEIAEDPAPPRRTLKLNYSDESTICPDGPTSCRDLEIDCSSISSSCTPCSLGGSVTGTVNRNKGRPGRRQKAKQRRVDFEDACRMAHRETIHEFELHSGRQGHSSWALGALTSVFESFAEDCHSGDNSDACMSSRRHAPSAHTAMPDCIESNDSESSSEERRSERCWQQEMQGDAYMNKHAEAWLAIPAEVSASYHDYRRVALEVRFDHADSLESAILSLEPHVKRLEDARAFNKEWKGPDSLRPTWSYMQDTVLAKPGEVFTRLEACRDKIANTDESVSTQGRSDLKYLRGDLYYCLENSISSFVEHVGHIQWCIDRDKDKDCTGAPQFANLPPPRKVSQSEASERSRVQSMSRDELQALLSSKVPKR